MKLVLPISLPVYLLLLLGNSACSQNSQPRVHKFSVFDDAPYCNGIVCTSSQFCDRSLTPIPRCVPKKELDQPCTGTGQCLTAHGECLGAAPSMSCKCVEKYVSSNGQCVPYCSETSDAPLGQCSTFNGFFCNTIISGCLPQVDLNGKCTVGADPVQCKTANATCTGETCNCGSSFVEYNGECVSRCTPTSCYENQYCDASYGLCKPKAYLNETCQDTVECLQSNSECISEGGSKICKCASSFVDYYGSCLPSCEATADCEDDQYCTVLVIGSPDPNMKNICASKAVLHEGCVEGAEDPCLDPNSSCRSSEGRQPTCECQSEFADKDGQCIESCTNVGCAADEFCNSQSLLCDLKRPLGESCLIIGEDECAASGSECGGDPQDPRCQCQPPLVQNGVNCVSRCSSNAECGDMYYCNKAFGICNPKIDLNGQCSKTDEDPCATLDAICLGDDISTCSCNSGFVEDQATPTCIRKCLSADDCRPAGETYCEIDTGSCKNKVDLEQECSIKPGENQCKAANSECSQVNATITDLVCKCKDGYSQRGNNACEPTCKSSSDCDSSNVYCDTTSGLCQSKVELNRDCSFADQCSTSFAECKDGRCGCKNDFVQWSSKCKARCTDSNGVCKGTEYCQKTDGFCYNKVGLHRPCNGDTNQCLSTSTECRFTSPASSDTTCECKSNTVESQNNCISKCTRGSGCNFETEYCDEISSLCRSKVDLNSGCSEEGTAQCFGPLTICKFVASSTQKKACQCTQGAIESVDTIRCLLEATAIQGACEEDRQCYALGYGDNSSAICTGNKCQCQPGFLNSGDAKRCLKVASEIYDSCEETQQCQHFDNGVPESVTCLDKKCQCQSSFVRSTDRLKCLKGMEGRSSVKISEVQILMVCN